MSVKKMKAFWHKTNNFGDALNPIILGHFLKEKIEFVNRETKGKMIAIGSIITAMRENDVVWGTGLIEKLQKPLKAPNGIKFLAVRGPLTRGLIDGNVPEIYGDPAILLPLIYKPERKIVYDFGYMPHYIDKNITRFNLSEKDIFIDITGEWKTIVDKMMSCNVIITSSLHGIIVAEAYGIPVVWNKYSDRIIGGQFKFQDYFLGTGRGIQKYGRISEKYNVDEKQKLLINQLETWKN